MDPLRDAVNEWPIEGVPSALPQEQIKWAANDLAKKVKDAVQNIFTAKGTINVGIEVLRFVNDQIRKPTALSTVDSLYEGCRLSDDREQRDYQQSLYRMGKAEPVPTAELIRNTSNDDREVLLKVITKIQSETFISSSGTNIQFNPQEAKIATLLYGVKNVKQSLADSASRARQITLLKTQMDNLEARITQLTTEHNEGPAPTPAEQRNFELELGNLNRTLERLFEEHFRLVFSE